MPDIVICHLCKKSVAKGGNTSNMLSHLKVHQPLEHNEAQAAAAKSYCSKQGQKKVASCDSTQYKQITVQQALKPKYRINKVRNGSSLLTL